MKQHSLNSEPLQRYVVAPIGAVEAGQAVTRYCIFDRSSPNRPIAVEDFRTERFAVERCRALNEGRIKVGAL